MGDRDKRWWWKRVVPLVLFLVVVGSYLGWGWYQQSQMNRQVEGYRAAGDPVWVEDFNRPTGVADEENAAVDLREAAGLIDARREEWKPIYDFWAYVPVPAEEGATLRAAVEAFPGIVERVEAATGKRGVDWQIPYSSPMVGMSKSYLNDQRDMARFLVVAAFEAHARGEDRTAVRRLRQALFAGRAVGEEYGFIEHLVSIGISSLASEAVAEIARELRVEDVGRAEMRGLVDDLLDEESYRAGALRSMIGSQAAGLDAVLTFGGAGAAAGTPRRIAWLLAQPLAWSAARPMMARVTAEGEAALKDNWASARAALPAKESGTARTPHGIVAGMMGDVAGGIGVRTHFLGLAMRRLAAVAVAARWYAAEHGGALPGELGVLVPDYLPATALADPMGGGSMLRYVSGPTRTVVYSVGQNGTDEGGSEKMRREWEPPDPMGMEDAVVHLTPRPRPVRVVEEY
jgi:hypothetical protein